MDSTTAIVTIVAAIITVMGGVLGYVFKNSRKSPESRDAQTNAWGQLNDRINKHLDWLTARVTTLESESAGKDKRLADLDTKVHNLESQVRVLGNLVSWFRSRVLQLTKHIEDSGDVVPEPSSPEPEA